MLFVCRQCKREVDTPGNFCPFCGAAAPAPRAAGDDPIIGRTLATKYFVNQLLGSGGMGQVYKGTDLVLERPVALKLLSRSFQGDPSMVQRFHREARAASRLNHPNCITILDYGQTEDQLLYIAMEFLPGRSLATMVAEEHQLDQWRVVRIVAQVLAALGEAHAHGVIHRDLKLSNVMVEAKREESDFVKVLDFGIAKLTELGEGQLTSTGAICGTPGYMSPEQARGEPLDARSDLYAVGVILHELLTGALPFESATPMGQMAKHLTEVPKGPRARRPDLDIAPDLDALVLRALAKNPADRPPSAEAMREELLACQLPAAAPRPATPRPGGPATMVLPAAGARPASRPPESPPAPGQAVRRFDVPVASTPRPAGQAPAVSTPRPPTASSARPSTPPKARTPRPATPAPPRRPTPAPEELPPEEAGDERTGDDDSGELEEEARPARRPTRPPAARHGAASPAQRSRRTWIVAGGVGGGALLLVLVLLFRSDPFSAPATTPPSGADAGLQLARPGVPPTPPPTITPPAGSTPSAGTTPPVGATPHGGGAAGAATPVAAIPAVVTPPPPPPAGGTPTGAAAQRPEVAPTTPVADTRPNPVRPVDPPVAAKPKKGSGVLETAEAINALKVPAASTGQGVLAVTASPWGVLTVDGKEIGETPRELRVGAGYYKISLSHPTFGQRESIVFVLPGKRAALNVNFTK